MNLSDYLSEITPALEALYGSAAAGHDQRAATAGIRSALASPQVLPRGLMEQGNAIAMLFARQEVSRTSIFFFHVLKNRSKRGMDQALLELALEEIDGFSGDVYTDYVSFCPLDVNGAYARHGFARTLRQIMRRMVSSQPLAGPEGFEIRSSAPENHLALGSVPARSYRAHVERPLHPEVTSEALATDDVRSTVAGHFGRFVDGYALGAWRNDQCTGIVLGSEVLLALGFVLHLVVDPASRNIGLGGALLAALCGNFADQGLRYTALGVTCDNSAVSWYEKTGFSSILQLPVFYRCPVKPVERGVDQKMKNQSEHRSGALH